MKYVKIIHIIFGNNLANEHPNGTKHIESEIYVIFVSVVQLMNHIKSCWSKTNREKICTLPMVHMHSKRTEHIRSSGTSPFHAKKIF